jgi:hypothetical protein
MFGQRFDGLDASRIWARHDVPVGHDGEEFRQNSGPRPAMWIQGTEMVVGAGPADSGIRVANDIEPR